MAEPQVNLRPQTVANPATTSMPVNPLLNKNPIVEPEQVDGREKHTVLPELSNAQFHMASPEAPAHCTCAPPYNVTCDYCMSLEDSSSPNFVPPISEADSISLRGLGVKARLARGGWKRVSINTVQSDDGRFTITCIDPTRRGKWFLLKDLETGESYEENTMTEAKQKAKEIVTPIASTCLSCGGRDDEPCKFCGEEDLTHCHCGDEDPRRVCADCGRYQGAEEYSPITASIKNKSNSKTTYRTAKKQLEEPMATKNSKWARLRQVAQEEPREADSALKEVADALSTLGDSLSNLRDNLDLIEAPKSASIKVRIAAARKYATQFRRIANDAPEVVADAISEVYHSLDDVAGALENLAENLGIDLSLSPAEAAFGEEGKEELGGEFPEETGEPEIDEEEFAEGENELDSSEGEEAEEEFDDVVEKEAAAVEWTTDRDEEGKPKSPVIATQKEAKQPAPKSRKCDDCKTKPYKETVSGRKLCHDCAEDARERKSAAAAGSTGFTTDRDENGEPKAPEKLEIPQAQGSTEVGKAAALARREALRHRIAKRHGIEL